MIGLNRRRTMGNALPYDAEIEYLESDGNQWIDTLLNVKSMFKVEIKFSLREVRFCGIYGSIISSDYGMFLSTPSGTGILYCNNTTTAGKTSKILTNNTDYTSLQYGTTLQFNGVTYTVQAPTATTSSMFLFARRANNGDAERIIKGQIYYFKIWDDDSLVLDLIPVRIGTVGYMYDKVSNQLFGNSGTGNFILGNDVN